MISGEDGPSQRWAFSPGNLKSEVRKVSLDPDAGGSFALSLTDVLPPIEVPEDTEWVKRFKMQSELLTEFWGHPIYLGATVLVPKDYETRTDLRFPVVYLQNHFSLDAPFGFTTEPPDETAADLFQDMRERAGGLRESGYDSTSRGARVISPE